MGQSTVLVIDGSAALRQQIQFVLSQQDYKVVHAATAGLGLRELQKESVCLIIVDSALSNFSVVHFLRNVRNLPSCSAVPVLFLRSDSKGQGLVEPAGAEDRLQHYLTKPFSSDGLMCAVRKSLEN